LHRYSNLAAFPFSEATVEEILHQTVYTVNPRFLQTILIGLLPFCLGNFNVVSAATSFDQVAIQSLPSDTLNSRKGNQESLNPNPGFKIKTIVIDAGHGGHDPGCLGGSSYEKDIVLGIALQMAKNIREESPDIKVILTRDEDVFIPLDERAAIANRNDADLFISIHANYIPKASHIKGSETYILGQHRMQDNLDVAMRENSAILFEDNYEQKYDYDPNSPETHIILSMFQNAYLEHSILFAQMVEDHMEKTGGRHSRGVKQAGFLVLRETAMPSVLVETGFLSNKDEEDFLRTEEGQATVANALSVAFQDYRKELEDSAPLAVKPKEPEEPPMVGPPAEAAFIAAAPTPPPAPQTVKQKGPEPTPPKVDPKPVIKDPEPLNKPVPVATALKEENPPKPSPIPGPGEPVATVPKPQPVPERPFYTDRVTPKVNVPPPRNPNLVEFRVQLAAAGSQLNMGIPPWNQLPYPIQMVEEKGYFKYQAVGFDTLEKASIARTSLRNRGFEDAFLVAYKGDQRISMAEAKAALNQ
jgi:N-acetylmuramoyl-L-alanine amidase